MAESIPPKDLALTGKDPTHFVVTRAQLEELVGGGLLAKEQVELFVRKHGLATKPSTFVASMLQHRSVDIDRVAEENRGRWLELSVLGHFQERGAYFKAASLSFR